MKACCKHAGSRPQCEELEPRRFLSGSAISIHGSSEQNDSVDVVISRKNVCYSVNGVNQRTVGLSRRIKEIDIYAGVFDGTDTQGDHVINVQVNAGFCSRIPIKIWGTDQSVNHISVNEDAPAQISMWGGNDSDNYFEATASCRRSSVVMHGGDSSSNHFNFGTNSNTVIGGNDADNIFSSTLIGSRGSITGGDNSSNVLETDDGLKPTGYRVSSNVDIQMTQQTDDQQP